MKKILILASGGLDSSVVVALYKNLGYDVHILYHPYGNINEQAEKKKLSRLMQRFDISTERAFVHPINLNYSTSECITGNTNGTLYVEMRNLIFLSYAISIAEAKGIEEIAVGFIKTKEEYKDTTEEFLLMINNLAVSTCGIEVKAPLKHLDKQGVYQLGKKLDIDLTDTFSCSKSSDADHPCGECYDCLDTKLLIKQCDIRADDNPFIN